MVDVSIIIVTYKMRLMLEELLHSIISHSCDFSYEIIIVENASNDGTVEMIHDRFPDVLLIINSKNNGVAKARNQGFAVASGRYLVTLDADMVFLENTLLELLTFMENTPDAGLAGCKLVFPNDEVQKSSRRFPSVLALLLRRLDYLEFVRNSSVLQHHEMSDWDRNDTREVDYVIGACQFIRRQAMSEIGVLDDAIFYGPEDLDYCLRMHRKK